MVNNPQFASPVISPRPSTASGLFSQVRDLVGDRLAQTVSGVNRIPHLIAASRASRPEADVSNELVAEVREYSPLPGRQAARHMRLDVQNNPGRQVDQVADAIQRYLNIEPRREPTADPKAEDSIVRHPQQIIQSNQRWNKATYYQFASNGAETYQIRPEYRAWGGGLELKLENEGTANIFAPSSSSPQPGPAPTGPPNSADDPLNAPDRAWSTATVVGEGLAAAAEKVIGGGLAAEFRPRGYDEAYVRVMRIIDELNIGRFPSGEAWHSQA